MRKARLRLASRVSRARLASFSLKVGCARAACASARVGVGRVRSREGRKGGRGRVEGEFEGRRRMRWGDGADGGGRGGRGGGRIPLGGLVVRGLGQLAGFAEELVGWGKGGDGRGKLL